MFTSTTYFHNMRLFRVLTVFAAVLAVLLVWTITRSMCTFVGIIFSHYIVRSSVLSGLTYSVEGECNYARRGGDDGQVCQKLDRLGRRSQRDCQPKAKSLTRVPLGFATSRVTSSAARQRASTFHLFCRNRSAPVESLSPSHYKSSIPERRRPPAAAPVTRC
jgi:hypothetical protein